MNQITSMTLSRVKGTNRAIVAMGYDSIESNIILSKGDGDKLPDPLTSGSYDLVWWNASDYLNPANDPYVEIVKCIAKVGDTVIVMRSQDGPAYDKNILGKTYGIAPIPINNSNEISSSTSSLSYYNIPQTHGSTLHDSSVETSTGSQSKVDTHASNTTTAHGAVSTAIASKIVIRDVSGNAKMAAPAAADDIAIRSTVDTVQTNLNSHATTATGIHNVGTSTVESVAGSTAKVTAHNVASGVHGITGSVVGTTDNQTLTTKTLTTPTIGDFTNANHTHAATGITGGVIAHTSLSSIGTNTHAQIDTAIGTTLPGSVTTHAGLTTGVHGVTGTYILGTEDLDTDINLAANSDAKIATQKATKAYADSLVVGLLDYRGAYNASVNTYPASGGSGSAGAILKGDMWIVSVAGTLGGTAIQIGDSLIANIDAPGQTVANWNTLNANVSYAPEDLANKVTSISGSSTDTQYPSAKLVYDQLTLKAPIGATHYIGTTAIALNRASASQALTGITSIDGNAATVTTNANLTGPVTSIGNATTITNAIVTYAKIQNVSATDKLLGRVTGGAGPIEEISCTAAGRTLLDDADASAQRTTLGLGTLATQSGTFSGTSSGTNTGDQTTITGNAGSATYASATTVTNDTSTAATMYPTWVTANTGNLPQKVSSTNLTFNPSTGKLTATELSGALTCPIVVTTAPYTAGASNHTIVVTSAGTITIPAATAVSAGKTYIIKSNVAGTVAITSTTNIDSALTYNMLARYETVCIQSDGTQWWVV